MSSQTVYRVSRLSTLYMRYRMLEHMAIDPIQLTKQLVNIESTTYCEGPAGVFLYEYLTAQRYAVERMPVEQPERATAVMSSSIASTSLNSRLRVAT